MKKITFLFILGIIFLEAASSQNSDTYKIEDLETPTQLLGTVSPDNLFGKIECNLMKLSIEENLVPNFSHAVLGGFLEAYKGHRSVTISPDIIWLLICQGFGQHVNNNAEELRNKFVDFQGQEELTVVRDVSSGTKIEAFPWEGVFPEFTEKIGNYTGKELMETLSADFTTTSPASLIASQITIMESMKKYFKYKVVMVGCGIPSVTIEGTVEDWKKILTKLDFLSRYDLEWWTSSLKPIVQEIINTKSGKKFNQNFWMDMIRYHREGLYGSKQDIDGWLVKFYPYGSDKKRRDLKKVKSLNDLPSEMVKVPFVFSVNSDQNTTVASYKMEFWAGFFGLSQNKQTYNLKPVIGWAINMLEEESTPAIH